MAFSKEEERILSEDTQDLYDRYMKVTADYEKSSSFDCKTVAILTALSAVVGACITEMIQDDHKDEAVEILSKLVYNATSLLKE